MEGYRPCRGGSDSLWNKDFESYHKTGIRPPQNHGFFGLNYHSTCIFAISGSSFLACIFGAFLSILVKTYIMILVGHGLSVHAR